MNILIIAGALTQQHQELIVIASREPVPVETAPLSATSFDAERIEALGLPLTSDLLRLAPGVSVASSGPKGSQTQLRIRGAEANHSLLFVDGIRFNDPAAGNEARFELLTSDALTRVELVRGPQSALWGSEALGGVVAVETGAPEGLSGLGEYGSLDSLRASAQGGVRLGEFALTGSLATISSDGIDSFDSGGERDGFDNRHASAKAAWTPSPAAEIGLVGHWIEGQSDFDGFDPATFRRADTLDATDNRLRALRGWGKQAWRDWSLLVDASLLDSENRNRLGDVPVNGTFGARSTAGAQLSRGAGRHRLTAAIEHEAEDFRGKDQAYGGATDQRRERGLTALIGEWRANWSSFLSSGLAVRHDSFSAFADATTVRASMSLRPAAGWMLHAAYGEGIAQPSFYDLYGFFPGNFVGNPALKPESSKGWEAGLRWNGNGLSAGLTGYSNRLEGEIVDIFDPVTFLSSTANVDGKSRRRGIEAEASAGLGRAGRLSVNYSYLDAEERQVLGSAAVREVRRPRHSANAVLTGSAGAFDWGASLAYVGARKDMDFDVFPAAPVTLGDYLLGSVMIGYRLSEAIEAYARVENALGADYRDVVGYETPGRTAYAGLRFRLGR